VGVALDCHKRVECNLCLGQETVPQTEGERVCHSGKYTKEVVFEIADGNLGGVLAVTTWRHKFEMKFVSVHNVVFHVVGNFIVSDVFLRCDTCA